MMCNLEKQNLLIDKTLSGSKVQVVSTLGQLEFGSDPSPETLHKFAEEYDPQKISELVKPTQHPSPV
jgi:hypothetical protein